MILDDIFAALVAIFEIFIEGLNTVVEPLVNLIATGIEDAPLRRADVEEGGARTDFDGAPHGAWVGAGFAVGSPSETRKGVSEATFQ